MLESFLVLQAKACSGHIRVVFKVPFTYVPNAYNLKSWGTKKES